MGGKIAQNPAAAMEEHKDRQGSVCVVGFHNMKFDRTAINIDRFFSDVCCRQLCAFLGINQHLTRILWRHLLHRLASGTVQGVEKRLHVTLRLRSIGKAVA